MPTCFIEFQGVQVKFNQNTILENVSFCLRKNEQSVLVGKSGSGKSTVLKTLIGVYKPVAGNIFFDSQPLDAGNIHLLRHQIAYIGQEPVLGAEQVKAALLLPFSFKAHKNKTPADSKLLHILDELDLKPKILEQHVQEVSGGEKQRLAIARALLLGKTFFLCDEVTSALDPESKQVVMERLFQKNHTILSVSHDHEWIERCQTQYEISNGILNLASP